jgi:NADH dehydrogenase [ubiquinone] 1 alpha subcomplex assembly factor 7
MIADGLSREIAVQGPMKLSRFMAIAVAHYYGGRDPFGQRGDFITAPEISQMFGEIVGVWAAVTWQMMGSPEALVLAELGPGRGTLMADLLRAAAGMPGFRQAARVHLVETSPALRRRQRRTLGETEVVWLDRVEQLPPGPAIIVANEFFDALPIDQYVLRADGWHERRVADGDEFHFVDGPKVERGDFPAAREGDIFEVNQAARDIAATLGRRFGQSLGAALVIDYGHAISAPGDTLQAVGRHRAAPPLSRPGEVDLTAHVDFAALARAAAPAAVSPLASQGSFLRRLGIELRAAKLAAARPDQAADLEAACQRLINPAGMGTLFKVLAISSAGLTDLPGFDA